MADIALFFVNYADVSIRRYMPTGLLAFHDSTKVPLAQSKSPLSVLLKNVWTNGVRYAVFDQTGVKIDRTIRPKDFTTFDKYIFEYMSETRMNVEKEVVPAPLRTVFKVNEALRLIDAEEGETVEITKVT